MKGAMSGPHSKEALMAMLGPLARAGLAMPTEVVDTLGGLLWCHLVDGRPVSLAGLAAALRKPASLVEKHLFILLAAGLARVEKSAWAPSDQLLQELLEAAKKVGS